MARLAPEGSDRYPSRMSPVTPAPAVSRPFLAGLFLTTLATLSLEILDTRLLSVITWYHLSFFAVSTAMFGMAAGAVRVYLGEEAFGGDAARGALARYATLLAIAIPVSHVVNLVIPIPAGTGMPVAIATTVTALVLAVPFYLSGVVVALCLTRIPGPSGLIYAVDLLGAALGAVAVLALFELGDITTGALVLGAVAAAGALCFHQFAGTDRIWSSSAALVLAVLAMGAGANNLFGRPIGVAWSKGIYQRPGSAEFEYWTVHGQVLVTPSSRMPPAYWGAPNPVETPVDLRWLTIDGLAGTAMTRWSPAQQPPQWVERDVTSLPYHLRKGGDNAVVGVGGGRDLLTALWGQSDSVLGIEINEAFLDLLNGPLRDYAGVVDDSRVSLIHEEARSFLTRTDRRFDVLQMSLVDTWAATGAGAFTLSENGLYTVEAWKTFLDTLQYDGLFSVSRWYSPTRYSETSRLLSLATAALLESGIEKPERHVILASGGTVATLVVSPSPIGPSDLTALDRASRDHGFEILLAPGYPPAIPLLAEIVASRSLGELDRVVADLRYDFTPPRDERPYFFNVLKPGFGMLGDFHRSAGVAAVGNLLATYTLFTLWIVTFVLVAATVVGPLLASGLPRMGAGSFACSLLYFGLIGAGFMLVQIPLMQRFSVYLGHPTWSLAVILFSMILATGVGSFFSDRIDVESRPRWLWLGPLLIAGNLLFWTGMLQVLIDTTIQFSLPRPHRHHDGRRRRCGAAPGYLFPDRAPRGPTHLGRRHAVDVGDQRCRGRTGLGIRGRHLDVERDLDEPLPGRGGLRAARAARWMVVGLWRRGCVSRRTRVVDIDGGRPGAVRVGRKTGALVFAELDGRAGSVRLGRAGRLLAVDRG